MTNYLGYSEDQLNAMFMLTERFYSVGRFADAELLAHQLREANPFDVRFYKLSAVIQSALENYENAFNLYKLASVIDPDDPVIWLNMGIAKLNLGFVNEAKKFFERSRKLGVGDDEVIYELDRLERILQ